MDRVLSKQESTVEGGTQKHVEDDLVDLKSERKRVERGKGLKSERKWLKSDRERRRIADEAYLKKIKELGVGPYDAIAPPAKSLLCGNLVPLPLNRGLRILLIQLSKIALEKYNDDNNQDPQFEPFEFDELVKSTRGLCAGYKYFITFKAKQSSNISSRIFQACVWRKVDKSSQVVSCAIKTMEG